MRTRNLVAAAMILALVAVAVIGADPENRQTSVRYLVWRHFAIGDFRNGARFLNVDPTFRRSFEGQPRSRLLRWFPDLRPGASRPTVCPDDGFRAVQDKGEWIADTPWLVRYDANGNVEEIMMPKGC